MSSNQSAVIKERLSEDVPQGLEDFLPESTRVLRKESGAGVAGGAEAGAGARVGAGAATPKLTRIAELILSVDARILDSDTPEGESTRMKALDGLAAQLGCQRADLEDIIESYGEHWQQIILEERIRLGIDSAVVRDATWDRLESATLRKLMTLVDRDLVKDTGELLMIAKTANNAIRGDRNGAKGGGGSSGNNVQTNIYLPGNPAGGVLPSGDLGRINLTLTHRVVKQIEGTAIREESGRQIDSVEMINVEEIREVIEQADQTQEPQE